MQLKGEGFLNTHNVKQFSLKMQCYPLYVSSAFQKENSEIHYEFHCYKMQIKAM